jgi:hypothetical protein
MPVVWAVDALGEAIADEEDTTEAEAVLAEAWDAYRKVDSSDRCRSTVEVAS